MSKPILIAAGAGLAIGFAVGYLLGKRESDGVVDAILIASSDDSGIKVYPSDPGGNRASKGHNVTDLSAHRAAAE